MKSEERREPKGAPVRFSRKLKKMRARGRKTQRGYSLAPPRFPSHCFCSFHSAPNYLNRWNGLKIMVAPFKKTFRRILGPRSSSKTQGQSVGSVETAPRGFNPTNFPWVFEDGISLNMCSPAHLTCKRLRRKPGFDWRPLFEPF